MSTRLNSTLYSAVGLYSNQALSLLTASVLSRLLEPSDFGIVALLLMINGFLSIFSAAGISAVIVQYRELSKQDLKALLGLCMLAGVFLAGVSFLCAPYCALFFSSEKLSEVLRVGSLSILIAPCLQVYDGVLVRDSRFGRRSLMNFSSAIIGSIVGISLALSGMGYWALVWQMIARSISGFVIGSWVAHVPPLPHLNFQLYKKIGKYAFNLIAFRGMNYWTQNMDNLIIGRYLSMIQLGYYSRAYALFNFSTNMIQAAIGPVLHASFRKLAHDPLLLKKDVIHALGMIACICFPVMGAVSIFGEEIIHLVWGPNWQFAVLPFSVLAVVGMFRPVQAVCGEVMKSLGQTRELIFWGIFKFFLFALCLGLGFRYGVNGVAIGVLVASVLNCLIFCNAVLFRHLKISRSDLYSIFISPIKITAVFVLTSYVLSKSMLWPNFSNVQFLFYLPILFIVLILSYRRFNQKIYLIFINVMTSVFRMLGHA